MAEKQVFFTKEMGAYLRSLRDKTGLSQDRFAPRMGITSLGGGSVVAKLERGATPNPTLGTLVRYFSSCAGEDAGEEVGAQGGNGE